MTAASSVARTEGNPDQARCIARRSDKTELGVERSTVGSTSGQGPIKARQVQSGTKNEAIHRSFGGSQPPLSQRSHLPISVRDAILL